MTALAFLLISFVAPVLFTCGLIGLIEWYPMWSFNRRENS